MAKPQTRQQLKEYCLRQLGAPVIEINVDDDQLEDRIDESIQIYNDYHYDGSEKIYLKHVITAEDITNEYLSVGDETISVISQIIQDFLNKHKNSSTIDDIGEGIYKIFTLCSDIIISNDENYGVINDILRELFKNSI